MICVITTAPGRPHVGNLETALHGHKACWVADTHLQGTVANYYRALRVALDICDRYGLQQILICQDDIELCTGALEYIEAFPVPFGAAFVEWFDGRTDQLWPAASFDRGCWLGWRLGRTPNLQAVTWPLRSLRAVLEQPKPAWWTPPHGVDDLLCCIAGDLHWKWAIHFPNLAQHVGAQSLVDPARTLTGNRISKNYPGKNFDARYLWATARTVSRG